ncbi:hypothetical protein F3Y22_tig00110372pilonHSYRG00031 [Hibiscus syriacus]|uniref:DUF599 domain-containing protein n=1 Tax=Hibiscus syriacus TaxID=106335 RepID=A0A6A3AWM1_HIBSY|nr:uncharacterized protein LOC120121467 [Hibiscus syriacus]KAE8707817.1 hypothetical protein F3Y22_tig00110372pilonHSYRG00031 [Hibiscus syriacus]
MAWRKEYLDFALVPTGLLIMSVYHVFLLYRCLKFPETTVIGLENHFQKAWVERMMQNKAKDRGISFTTIDSTISASIFLATTSLTLSSLIGTWLADASQQRLIKSSLIYGNTSSSINSVKYIALLICFLLAFGSFLQCVRNFVHASFLITMPNADIPVSYAQKAVIRGGACWSIGLRAIYYATVLLLWIFGPIPMFIGSLIMVMVLHLLDRNVTPLHQFEEPKLIE